MIASAAVRTLCVVFLVMPLIAATASASAQRAACSDSLDDREVRARLAALEQVVRREEPAMRRWWTTFLFLHGTMASGAAILAGTANDPNFRDEMLMGTLSSTLALATLAFVPPPLMGGGDSLRALPEATAEDRLRKLRAAEDLLRRQAGGTDFLRSWLPPTLSALYVTAAASVLLLAFQRPQGALTHSIGGAVLGTGRILLHPFGARDAWRSYLRRHPDADCDATSIPAPVATRVQVGAHGLGLGLRIDF